MAIGPRFFSCIGRQIRRDLSCLRVPGPGGRAAMRRDNEIEGASVCTHSRHLDDPEESGSVCAKSQLGDDLSETVEERSEAG